MPFLLIASRVVVTINIFQFCIYFKEVVVYLLGDPKSLLQTQTWEQSIQPKQNLTISMSQEQAGKAGKKIMGSLWNVRKKKTP